jgi:hypothetical protein
LFVTITRIHRKQLKFLKENNYAKHKNSISVDMV